MDDKTINEKILFNIFKRYFDTHPVNTEEVSEDDFSSNSSNSFFRIGSVSAYISEDTLRKMYNSLLNVGSIAEDDIKDSSCSLTFSIGICELEIRRRSISVTFISGIESYPGIDMNSILRTLLQKSEMSDLEKSLDALSLNRICPIEKEDDVSRLNMELSTSEKLLDKCREERDNLQSKLKETESIALSYKVKSEMLDNLMCRNINFIGGRND